MICIVDFGMGNIRSITKKISKLGKDCVFSSDSNIILSADKLIIPGVGHFGEAMLNLKKNNLLNILNKRVIDDGVPVLGICLGMQLFMDYSEEGNCAGFGWIKGQVVKFSDKSMKIPHVGWNTLKITSKSKILDGFSDEDRFYFTHSYHVDCSETKDITSTTFYGYDFVSAIQKNNIYAVQFHPEKSHLKGFKVIENFVKG